MNVKINSRFTVTLRNKDNVLYNTKKHNAIYQSYQNLLSQLLVSGSPYPKGEYYPPSNVYIVLLNNGNVVKQIPVTLESFNENFNTVSTSNCSPTLGSCNLNQMSFTLKHTAVDSSTDSYTFDTIEIVAGTSTSNTYAIAYININSVTKGSSDTLTVSWEATVTIVSNGVFYIPGCTDPTFKANYSVNNLQTFQPLLCLNLPYILTALSLIPYNQIPQNSFLYKQVNILLSAFGASLSSATPSLSYQGVQYYVINNTAYPINQTYPGNNADVFIIFLYGVNDAYFFYSLEVSSYLESGFSYTLSLTVNLTLE